MSGLKKLKDRISNVKSTKKITKALQLVSAVQLRKTQRDLDSSTMYFDSVTRIAKQALSQYTGTSPVITGGKQETVLCIVLSSDRGLCGSLNSCLLRKLRSVQQELGIRDLFCVGKKALDFLRHNKSFNIVDSYTGIEKEANNIFIQAEEIVEKILGLLDSNSYGRVVIAYNKFFSAINQEQRFEQLIPLQNEELDSVSELNPSDDKAIEEIALTGIIATVYRAILENKTSENGSRMVAMDNATQNADEMVSKLSLVYNRTRQLVITNQLIEIVSGAESL